MIDINAQNINNIMQEKGVLVLYCTADWCGPCKKLGPRLEEDIKALPGFFFLLLFFFFSSPSLIPLLFLSNSPSFSFSFSFSSKTKVSVWEKLILIKNNSWLGL